MANIAKDRINCWSFCLSIKRDYFAFLFKSTLKNNLFEVFFWIRYVKKNRNQSSMYTYVTNCYTNHNEEKHFIGRCQSD